MNKHIISTGIELVIENQVKLILSSSRNWNGFVLLIAKAYNVDISDLEAGNVSGYYVRVIADRILEAYKNEAN